MLGDTFLPGEYFVYCCGPRWELGKVKRRCDDNPDFYFCYYSSGSTAARTCVTDMHKLMNGDGGPAHQYTLGEYACAINSTHILEVTNYFTGELLWIGKVCDLPYELHHYPVEETGGEWERRWAKIC